MINIDSREYLAGVFFDERQYKPPSITLEEFRLRDGQLFINEAELEEQNYYKSILEGENEDANEYYYYVTKRVELEENDAEV